MCILFPNSCNGSSCIIISFDFGNTLVRAQLRSTNKGMKVNEAVQADGISAELHCRR